MPEKQIHRIAVGFLATNCWIYPLENEGGPPNACAVIDPGEDEDSIIALLDKLNLFPEYILLTHGHFDHIGAVPALDEEYRKRQGLRQGQQQHGKPVIAIHAADVWLGEPQPDRTLAEGDQIGPFTVLHIPGHSPGSIGLWDREAGILFSGDTLFCDGYGRTDFSGGNEADLFASLKRLFAMDGGIKVYPGHDKTTTIGTEAKRGYLAH